MITIFTGPMHSGKTAHLIEIYNKMWNKNLIKCFKAKKDTRDYGILKSGTYSAEIEAINIDKFEEILVHINDSVRTIFIDEVQLIEGNINVLTYLSLVKDIDIYMGGLNMTSEQNPFLKMSEILAICDNVEVIKASCYDCGRDASYTYYEGNKTKDVLIGNEGYIPLCSRCLLKREGAESLKKMLLK